jgi:hypothetical protein
MKRLLLLISIAVVASPASTFACNGSITCAVRQAPRQIVEMLPGFFSAHAGLLAGAATSAIIVGLSLSRRARAAVRDD